MSDWKPTPNTLDKPEHDSRIVQLPPVQSFGHYETEVKLTMVQCLERNRRRGRI